MKFFELLKKVQQSLQFLTNEVTGCLNNKYTAAKFVYVVIGTYNTFLEFNWLWVKFEN